jgi:hypothetical protein
MRRILGRPLVGLAAVLMTVLVPISAMAQSPIALSESAITTPLQGGGSLYDQSNACGGNGPASQQFPDFGNNVIQSADDFTVPAGFQWTITGAMAAGAFFNANPNNGPIAAVVVQIWSDAAGLPDALLCQESGANGSVDPNTSLTLAGACAAIMPLTEGTYWISIMAQMNFAPSGQYAWVPNNSTNGAQFAFQDPAGLTGNPCTTWGAGISTCGVGSSFPDMCFALDGTEEPVAPDVPIIEVPTLGQFGIALLVLALLGLGVSSLRRRKTA